MHTDRIGMGHPISRTHLPIYSKNFSSLHNLQCTQLLRTVESRMKKKIDKAVKYNLSNLIQLFLLRTLCMLGYASLAERRGIMRDDGHFTCQPDFSYSHSQFFLIAIFHSLRGERYVFASTCLTALNWFVKMCAWIMYSTFGCCTSKLIQSCGYFFSETDVSNRDSQFYIPYSRHLKGS